MEDYRLPCIACDGTGMAGMCDVCDGEGYVYDVASMRRDFAALLKRAEDAEAANARLAADNKALRGLLRLCKAALMDTWANSRLGSAVEQALFELMNRIDDATGDEPNSAQAAHERVWKDAALSAATDGEAGDGA